jgi:hypothetical protein
MTFTLNAPWNVGSQLRDWLNDRAFELTYTSEDLRCFALELGDNGEPFTWDPSRRTILRAELDAAFLHIYGIDSRDDVAYILSTFPIVNRRDPDLAGRVLGAYDALANAAETGVSYVSPLEPPPGKGLRNSARPGAKEGPSA